ncbi:MAG: hypothetical protein ACE5H2_03440 [Terriglobia bacterium]
MVEYERRRTEREKYGALRALAQLNRFYSYTSLVLGILAAAMVMAFAEMPGPAKLIFVFVFLLSGGFGFFHLQAQAQMIYILFDIARNSRVSCELLEQTPEQ